MVGVATEEDIAMNHCCLHVEVTLNVTPAEWLARCEAAVPLMTRLPGLVWKLWVLDEDEASAGGLYLFENRDAAAAYAEGPVIERLRASGVARAVRVRLLPLVDDLSQRTRGLADSALAVLPAAQSELGAGGSP
jgi:hypothetical protein